MDRAHDQSQSADQQHQHQQGIEKAGWLKVNMHVGDDAGQDEQRAAHDQQPTR